MSSPLERLAKSLLLTGLLISQLLLAPGVGAEKATIVMTGELEQLYPTLADDPKFDDLHLIMEEKVTAIMKQEEDAYLVDSGWHQSLPWMAETSYNAPSYSQFRYMHYDAVHLDGRDAILSTDTPFGLIDRPEETNAHVFTRIQNTRPEPLNLKFSREPKKKGNVAAEFFSLADLREAQGFGGRKAMMHEVPLEDVLSRVRVAREAGRLTVGFASSERTLAEPGSADSLPRPHVIVVRGLAAARRAADGAWLIPTPRFGEVAILTVNLEEDQLVVEPEIRTERYISEDDAGRLRVLPKLKVGEAIPNIEQILEQFFPDREGQASLDRYPSAAVQDLTETRTVFVYTAKLGGRDHRLYRVRGMMPNYRHKLEDTGGWPHIDMIVAISADDSVMQRYATRINFPLFGEQTSIPEALNRLRGVPMENWETDDELTTGLPEVYGWGTYALGRVVLVDRALNPPAVAGDGKAPAEN